jgi:intracellular sulfur oxidation DsrE/DsrF family protein
MPGIFLFKRRQLLRLGGTGVVSFLGGAVVTKAVDVHASSSVQSGSGPLTQNDAQVYLSPGGFDQQFLAKSADVRQIWDFVTVEQIQPQGLTAIRNALNAFQFTYKKTLYPVICLRGNAVIYALDDNLWMKYSLATLAAQKNGGTTGANPLYSRQTSDNGSLDPQDPDSLYQDPSLQALQQRGVHVAACHDALNGLAGKLAEPRGLTTDSVFTELAAHLIPGAQQTPSGSSLIAVAQHLGFTYAKQ